MVHQLCTEERKIGVNIYLCREGAVTYTIIYTDDVEIILYVDNYYDFRHHGGHLVVEQEGS